MKLMLKPTKYAIDCIPEPYKFITENKCMKRRCIWNERPDNGKAKCILPLNTGYEVDRVTGDTVFMKKTKAGALNGYDVDMPLRFTHQRYGAALNLRITGRENTRFKTRDYVIFAHEKSVSSDELIVEVSKSKFFYFVVKRKSTGTVIWDTSIGGMMFADKFIQIATKLPSTKLYGFGENIHQTLKHDFTNYTTWGMFARDEFPNSAEKDGKNLYGVHGFYLALEPDNKAHGVLILNSNAQEVTTMPGPALVYRTIGGMLDIFFFPGPTPEEVIQQYTTFIGKPTLPAYFSLGFQLCRYGYKDLNELKSVVSEVKEAKIPLDVVYADIEYMHRYNDFTVGEKWNGFGEYIRDLKVKGKRTILIFDCGIRADDDAFVRAIDQGAAFIEWETKTQVPRQIQQMYPKARDTKIMLAVVWPDGHTAFPDFYDRTGKTTKWWIKEFVNFHEKLEFDGIWIDMNEPAAFGTNEQYPWYFNYADHPNITSLKCPLIGDDSRYDNPPFKTFNVYRYGDNAHLSTKTLCMLALTDRGKTRFYDTKSLFGLAETRATFAAQHASTGKRGIVISRSTFPSTGHYGGHWLGDNTASWNDLRTSVIGVQEFNLFGIPYVGSDICGFLGDTNEELCLRWHQVGAFHSFSRNHNDRASKPHHPTVWKSVANMTRQALLMRYYYLPYLYSLHFEAAINGGTVIRPVFFEFPNDTNTHDLGYQFLWGSSIMFIPVVHQGAVMVNGYIPEGIWYSIRDVDYGNVIQSGMQTLTAPINDMFPVLVRGGSIIIRQKPEVTTMESRRNDLDLLIAPDEHAKANGYFYWDDGESIVEAFKRHHYLHWKMNFSVVSDTAELIIACEWGTGRNLHVPYLTSIDVFGMNKNDVPNEMSVNGRIVKVKSTIKHNAVNIRLPGTDLSFRSVELSWKIKRAM